MDKLYYCQMYKDSNISKAFVKWLARIFTISLSPEELLLLLCKSANLTAEKLGSLPRITRDVEKSVRNTAQIIAYVLTMAAFAVCFNTRHLI